MTRRQSGRYQSSYISELIQDLIDVGLSLREIARRTRLSYSSIYGVHQSFNNSVSQQIADKIINLHCEEFTAPVRIESVNRRNLGVPSCGAPSIDRYIRGCRCEECRYIANSLSRRQAKR